MLHGAIQFLLFWYKCVMEGIHVADGLFAIIEGGCIFIGALLHWHDRIPILKKYTEQWEKWEGTAMKWAAAIFIVSFLISTVFIAPFLQFREKNKEIVTLQSKITSLNAARDEKAILVKETAQLLANQLFQYTDGFSNGIVTGMTNDPAWCRSRFDEWHWRLGPRTGDIIKQLEEIGEYSETLQSTHVDYTNFLSLDTVFQINKFANELNRIVSKPPDAASKSKD